MTNEQAEKLLAFVKHIASFQTHSEVNGDEPADYQWIQNDSDDLETLVLEARKLIQWGDQ